MATIDKKNKKDQKDQKETAVKDLYSGEAKKEAAKKRLSPLAYRLLIKPLVTEKATNLSAHNQYVFEVEKGANKIEVAKAIESVYGIKPESVNMVNMKGKRVQRGRVAGKRSDWKKAIVTLPKGQTIQIYEGV